jgi:hypothetical protein
MKALASAFALLVALALPHPCLGAGNLDHEERTADRVTQYVVANAKMAFPLRLLTIHRVPQNDESVVYLFTLDARPVRGAPSPVIQSSIVVRPGAPMHAIQRAIRDASAEVVVLLQKATESADVLLLRPDLITPNNATAGSSPELP